MRRRLIWVRLTPKIVVARHIAVVGCENDQGLVEPTALFERLENPADLLVHMADRPVVSLPGSLDFAGAEFAAPDVVAVTVALLVARSPLARASRREVRFGVHAHESLGRVVGTMRADERH